MRQWKSVGIFGEHGLESIHHLMNEDFRAYCSVKDKSQRERLMFSHHNLKLSCDSKPFIAEKRKCHCGGYFKLGVCNKC